MFKHQPWVLIFQTIMFILDKNVQESVLGEGHDWVWWPYKSTLVWLNLDMKGYLVETNNKFYGHKV